MLALMLLLTSSISLQVEEVADVSPEVERELVRGLSALVAERTGEFVSVIDCRTSVCEPKDAGAPRERLHLLMFGGPKRISLSLERVGDGVSLTSTQYLQNEAADHAPTLRQLVRDVYPNAAARALSTVPELIAVDRPAAGDAEGGSSALSLGGALIAGLGLAGALTFGIMAHGSQSELSSKVSWDAEVPRLEASRDREVGVALGSLGLGVIAGVVALAAEIAR